MLHQYMIIRAKRFHKMVEIYLVMCSISNNFCHVIDFSAHGMDISFCSGVVSKAVSVYTVITRYGYLMRRSVAAHHKSKFQKLRK